MRLEAYPAIRHQYAPERQCFPMSTKYIDWWALKPPEIVKKFRGRGNFEGSCRKLPTQLADFRLSGRHSASRLERCT
jgi:hypothetical protein